MNQYIEAAKARFPSVIIQAVDFAAFAWNKQVRTAHEASMLGPKNEEAFVASSANMSRWFNGDEGQILHKRS
ncbi:hypothetical protein AJ80_06716 [Polytolypa hystricis UAMH7299]|uniref:Uncharacterized protein n=1 Tax=Polytolypa hystricis (strain UAMH7299) TaxID=1447883 RepID=A0A2B7XTX2_POLH7|nr:hypothetical protein AJ80_06716 [Polytolypa hystricis UAMH7299]